MVNMRPEGCPPAPYQDKDDEVKVVWDKKNISQADPTPYLQSLSVEELIPGEKSLLDATHHQLSVKL